MIWPDRRLSDLLGIEHPIIQAPMAGSTPPALAAAVAEAGGLGSIGCAEMTPEQLSVVLSEVRSATARPVNLNFFAHAEPTRNPRRAVRAKELLGSYYAEFGLGVPPEFGSPMARFDEARLTVLREARPPVVSFHFGLPETRFVEALKEIGTRILCTATTPAEARDLQARGVDAVIAQGWEAGGHHGFYRTPEGACMGTLALVPQVVDAVDVPVVAAGGIADGRGIAAALALGASGVQIGTVFLTTTEASVSRHRRAAMLAAEGSDTTVSRAWTGRPARGLANRYVDEMAPHERELPEFPLMDNLSLTLESAGLAAGTTDFAAYLAGQAVGLNREGTAAELMEALLAETRAVLSQMRG